MKINVSGVLAYTDGFVTAARGDLADSPRKTATKAIGDQLPPGKG